MRYVTEVAKTGDEICINLKKITLAIPVPITPKIKINQRECCTFSTWTTSAKSVKNKIPKAGKSNIKKFPVVMLKEVRSERYFLIRFTFVA